MKSAYSTVLIAAFAVLGSYSAMASEHGPQTEPPENFKYEVPSNNGAHLSMFKLFTITPEKKSAPLKSSKIATPKVEGDKKPQAVYEDLPDQKHFIR